MDKWEVIDPNTGEKFEMWGDREPTNSDVRKQIDILKTREKAESLRSLTRSERAMTQMVQAPREIWDKTLEEKGIDPKSRYKFDMASVPANVARFAAMSGGASVGAAAGGIPGAIGGGAFGKLTVDKLLEDEAKRIAGTEKDTIGLESVLGETRGTYTKDLGSRASSLTEGGVYGGLAAGGPAVNKFIGKTGKQIIEKGVSVGKQTARKVAATKGGQVAAKVTEPLRRLGSQAASNIRGGIEAVDDFLLRNISIMHRGMKDFIDRRGGWRRVMHAHDRTILERTAVRLKKPISKLTEKEMKMALATPNEYNVLLAEKVERDIVPSVHLVRSELGRTVAEAKKAGGLFDPSVTIDVSPEKLGFNMLDKVDDLMQSYTTLLPSQRRLAKSSVRKIMGEILDPETGAITGYSPRNYGFINDRLNILDDMLGKGYNINNPNHLKKMSANDAFMMQIRKLVDTEIKKVNPALGTAAEEFSKFMTTLNEFNKYVGYDKQQILDFFATHYFADPTAQNVYGQNAMRALFSADKVGAAKLEDAALLATEIWGRGGTVGTAGVKTFAPVLAARIAGGAAGLAIGASIGAGAAQKRGGSIAKGAAIGGAVGMGIVLSHITPSMTTKTRMALEGMSPAVKLKIQQLANKAPATITAIMKYKWLTKSRPLLDNVLSIQDKFGVEVTDEDAKQLKSSRVGATQ